MASSPESETFAARWVFPIDGAPIAGGRVTIRGDVIVGVGDTAETGKATDLGNVAILPGLINPHSHLEFSQLTEPVPAGRGFPDWVRAIVEVRRERGEQSTASVALGLEELKTKGVAYVGEIAQENWSPEPFAQSPLSATVFLEILGLTPSVIPAKLELAEKHLRRRKHRDHWYPGLSPHAPYSVHPDLLEGLIELAIRYNVPLAMHLAESREELELVTSGKGPFRSLLEEVGIWQGSVFAQSQRPLDYLKRLVRAPRSLVIHGNYLDDPEIEFLGANRDRMSVVYCPRTHEHFGHRDYPLPELLKAGARVAVGTDSRASNPNLCVLSEMQTVARIYPQLSGEAVVRLATLSAAEALGQQEILGSIKPGKHATMTLVSLPSYDARDPYELLWDGNCTVEGLMIEGQWVVPPGK